MAPLNRVRKQAPHHILTLPLRRTFPNVLQTLLLPG